MRADGTGQGNFADMAGWRNAKGVLEAVVTGAHNVVTYFSNATNLRGTALRFGEPGGGRRIHDEAARSCLRTFHTASEGLVLGSSAWANMELTSTKGGYGPLVQ